MRLQGSVKRWSGVKTEHAVSVCAATPTARSRLASPRSGISYASHRMLPRRWIVSNSSASLTSNGFWRAARAETAAHQLAYLRQFFTWCRRHKLTLTDPTAGLWRDSKPVFAGPVLSLETQRQLYSRWTNPSDDVHPYEPAVGLLAMLHALSRRDLTNLQAHQVGPASIELTGRPEPVPLDPTTSDAIARAAEHRDSFDTANPHLIINKANARNRRPVNPGYLTGVMSKGPAVTLRSLRATRLSALVGDLDPITVSAAIGIGTTTAMYYLNDPEPRICNGFRVHG